MSGSNQYFNKIRRRTEQNLTDDLIRESIAIHGIDFIYLPRQLEKLDLLYGEDVLSKFTDQYDLCMYIESSLGFQGDKDLITSFGVEIKDQATLLLARSEWDQVVGEEQLRPKEGDLIFYPLNKAMFEIKFVDNEAIHYQLGDLYVYKLSIEQFSYANEKFGTGIDEVDAFETNNAQSFTLQLVSGTGTYQINESVYQGTSFANATYKAIVSSNNDIDSEINVINVVGQYNSANGPLVGVLSGSSHTIFVDKYIDINDPGSDNKRIQVESDEVIDHTERDIFSGEEF